MDYLKNNKKTMWLYARNAGKELKNQEMLIHTSKIISKLVARLDYTYNPKRLSREKDQTVCYSHFDQNSYNQHTDICFGARVAISNVNFLPEIGLYDRPVGDVIEIVYNDRPVRPNNKQDYHIPNYVVVNFPNLWLPTNIAQWDDLHKTVSVRIPFMHISTLLNLSSLREFLFLNFPKGFWRSFPEISLFCRS